MLNKQNDFVRWRNHSLRHTMEARRDSSHALDSATFERNHMRVVSSRSLGKDGQWRGIFVAHFDRYLSFNERLY